MSNFCIATWNAQSHFSSNWKETLRFLKKSRTQILCVQDVGKITTSQQKQNFKSKKFNMIWATQQPIKSRNFAIVINKNIEIIEDFKFYATGIFHGIVKIGDRYIRIWNIYVPPGEGKEQYKSDFLKVLKSQHKIGVEDIICGDFNMLRDPSLDFMSNNQTSASKKSTTSEQFFDTLIDLHFLDAFRALNGKTLDYSRKGVIRRKKKLQITQSRIDYIFTSDSLLNILTSCYISSDLLTSDHRPVVCEIDIEFQEDTPILLPTREKICIPKQNDDKWVKWEKEVEKCFSTKISDDINTTEDIDHISQQIQECLISLSKNIFKSKIIDPNKTETPVKTPFMIKQHIKYRRTLNKLIGQIAQTICKSQQPFTFSQKTEKQLKKLVKFQHLIQSSILDVDPHTDAENWLQKASIIRKQLTKTIHKLWKENNSKKFKENFEKILLAQEEDINVIYKRLQTRSKKPITRIASPYKGEIRLLSEGEDVKKATQHFWQEIFSSRSDKSDLTPPWLSEKISTVPSNEIIETIAIEEIVEAIKSCANNKGSGPDEIVYEMLKHLPMSAIHIISNLFNKCLKLSHIPNNWNQSTLFPIFKKGNPKMLSNYRPICLLPALYKVFSKILTKRLSNFVENNNLLHGEQSGFRPGHETFSNIHSLLRIIEHAKSKNRELHFLYIDITKAYDSVEHWAIEQALEAHNIHPTFIKLVKNILINNSACMITGHGPTDNFPIKSGVKQGDPLSPLLFIIFLNALIKNVKSNFKGYNLENLLVSILAYADDIVLISENKEEIQNMLKAVVDFLDFNNMSLNIAKDKSAYSMLNCPDPPQLFYKDLAIPVIQKKESYTYLGIDINMRLDFSDTISKHISQYKSSVNSIVFKAFSIDQIISLINTVSNPIMGYLMSVVNVPVDILQELDLYTVNLIKTRMCLWKNADADFFYFERNLKKLVHLQVENLVSTSIERLAAGNSLAAKIIHLTNNYKFSVSYGFNGAKFLASQHNYEVIDTLGFYASLDHMLSNDPVSNYLINELKKAKFRSTQQLIHADGKIKDLLNRELKQCNINTQIHPEIWNRVVPKWTNSVGKLNPQLLTNINLPFLHDIINFTTLPESDSEVSIWTDGSFSNNNARSAIYIQENHTANKVISTFGNQNILNAELQAIEMALIVGAQTPLHIISDSLNAIKVIDECVDWNTKAWRKSHTRATLMRIRELIKTRKKTLRFTHVYSHIDEKIRRAKSTSKEEFEHWSQKIENLKSRLGQNFENYIKGNNTVDRMLTESTTTPQDPKQLLYGLPRYVVLKNKEPVEFNLRAHINNTMVENDVKAWIKRCPVRTLYRTNNTILDINQKSLFSRSNFRNNHLANFWHKVKQRVISSKDKFHKFFKSKKPPNNSASIEEATQYKYSETFYSNNLCIWCKNGCADTFEHAVSTCVKTTKTNNILNSQCLEIINKFSKWRVVSTNLWFHHSRNFPTPDMFKNFDKNLGSIGFIPTCLPDVLKNWGVPHKLVMICIQEIFSKILANRYDCWRKRWECFNKHQRTAQVKKQIKSQIKNSKKKKKVSKRKRS